MIKIKNSYKIFIFHNKETYEKFKKASEEISKKLTNDFTETEFKLHHTDDFETAEKILTENETFDAAIFQLNKIDGFPTIKERVQPLLLLTGKNSKMKKYIYTDISSDLFLYELNLAIRIGINGYFLTEIPCSATMSLYSIIKEIPNDLPRNLIPDQSKHTEEELKKNYKGKWVAFVKEHNIIYYEAKSRAELLKKLETIISLHYNTPHWPLTAFITEDGEIQYQDM